MKENKINTKIISDHWGFEEPYRELTISSGRPGYNIVITEEAGSGGYSLTAEYIKKDDRESKENS